MDKRVQLDSNAWIPLDIQQIDEEKMKEGPTPVKSFYDYQDVSEAYEVRGILPEARITFKDLD